LRKAPGAPKLMTKRASKSFVRVVSLCLTVY
jgi:hypothetical protein